jgi:hypothetical protein
MLDGAIEPLPKTAPTQLTSASGLANPLPKPLETSTFSAPSIAVRIYAAFRPLIALPLAHFRFQPCAL